MNGGQEDLFDMSHWFGHITSTVAVMGAIGGYLPAAAALVAVTWGIIQIYESHTVQHYLRGRRERKIASLTLALARLNAQELLRTQDPARDDVALGGVYRVTSTPRPTPSPDAGASGPIGQISNIAR